MFYTYILHNSEIDRFYIGSTSNIEARIEDHNIKNHKTKYTRKQAGEWKLVYKEEFINKTDSIKREREIKRWKSKKMILKLLEQSRP